MTYTPAGHMVGIEGDDPIIGTAVRFEHDTGVVIHRVSESRVEVEWESFGFYTIMRLSDLERVEA